MNLERHNISTNMIDFLWHSRILHVIYISVFHVDAYIISLVNEHLILSLYDSDS